MDMIHVLIGIILIGIFAYGIFRRRQRPIYTTSYPLRPMANGERRALWSSRYYMLYDKPYQHPSLSESIINTDKEE